MATRNHNPYLKDNSEIHWKDNRFSYSGDDLQYKGSSLIHKADTSEGNLWYIWKYSYTAGVLSRIEGPLVGNWDSRNTLGWS
jgi:hypothetical protein